MRIVKNANKDYIFTDIVRKRDVLAKLLETSGGNSAFRAADSGDH